MLRYVDLVMSYHINSERCFTRVSQLLLYKATANQLKRHKHYHHLHVQFRKHPDKIVVTGKTIPCLNTPYRDCMKIKCNNICK